MAYGNGRLYAIDTFGTIYCINGENGNEIFRTELDPCSIRFFTGGIALCDGKLYAVNCYGMYIVNAENGDEENIFIKPSDDKKKE